MNAATQPTTANRNRAERNAFDDLLQRLILGPATERFPYGEQAMKRAQ